MLIRFIETAHLMDLIPQNSRLSNLNREEEKTENVRRCTDYNGQGEEISADIAPDVDITPYQK